MKKSFYNIIVEIEEKGGAALYNTKTNSLAFLNMDEVELFKKDLNNNEWEDSTWEKLYQGGYIVPDEINELDEIKYRLNKSRFDTNHLQLTIAPTADCNFRCSYCYEKLNLKKAYMEDGTIDSLLSFIENQSKTIDKLDVCWYGGEPLLAIKTVEKISNKILELRDKYKFMFDSSIITNGLLLNRQMVIKLNNLNISSYQVTLDGTEEQHNRRRFQVNGEGSFDSIIKNLTEINDICPDINIRINIDRNNLKELDELIALIKEIDLNNKYYPYLGRIESYNDIYNKDLCFNMNDFYQIQRDFAKKYYKNELLNLYPSLKGNFCCADCINSFVVSHDGYLYKCWSDLGTRSKAVGKLVDGDIKYFRKPYYYNLINYDPTDDDSCKKCKFLPICMGGCPYERIINNKKQCLKKTKNMHSFIKDLCLEML
ncbi:radical SAM protein [Lagierella sp.]|uniref:radical SAM/SPASM domain-containing protein n=1 Tax=Lagierella sp. TaxID=2849657 RepID=UPI0026209C41|nr:radical SAM protein [Lagierella sp.]